MHFTLVCTRFPGTIPALRKSEFCRGKTRFSAKRKSPSENRAKQWRNARNSRQIPEKRSGSQAFCSAFRTRPPQRRNRHYIPCESRAFQSREPRLETPTFYGVPRRLAGQKRGATAPFPPREWRGPGGDLEGGPEGTAATSAHCERQPVSPGFRRSRISPNRSSFEPRFALFPGGDSGTRESGVSQGENPHSHVSRNGAREPLQNACQSLTFLAFC